MASAVVSRSGLSPVMVGRSGELHCLTSLFQALDEPKVVLVAGEPGIGKSRLVQEARSRLSPEVPVLVIQAEEGFEGRPYGVLLDALAGYVSRWTAVPEELGAHRAPLAVLLGPIAPRLVTGSAVASPEELRRAASRLVDHLTGPGAAMVVFEDLQWADPESLAVFSAMAVTPGLARVLVGTHRSGDPSSGALADLLAWLERRCQIHHYQLQPLSFSEVAEMLAAVYKRPVTLRAAEAVRERSSGNPFFIEELIVAAEASSEQPADVRLPESFTDAILRRFNVLPELDRRVATVASVLGRRIPFDLLAAVTCLGEDDLLAALKRLVAGRLLIEHEPDAFSFRHALTREAVASGLLARERRRVHEKALVALQEAGSEDWAVLAGHAAGAGRVEEELGAARAGAAASLRAGDTVGALRLADRGLRLADNDVVLHEFAAKAAIAAGMPETALEHARRWHALADTSGDNRGRIGALVALARLQWETGDWADQETTIADAIALAEAAGPSRELVMAYAVAADARRHRHDPAGTLEWTRRGLVVVEQIGAPERRPSLLVSEAGATACTVEGAEQAAGALERAVAEAEQYADSTTALRGLRTLLVAMSRGWPAERNHAVLARMRHVADRWGRQDWHGEIARLEAAQLAEHQGQLAAARQVLSALDYDDALVDTARARMTTFMAAQLALEAADSDADAFVARARRQAETGRNPHQMVWGAALATEAAARRGNGPGAVAHLHELQRLLTRPDAPFLWDFWCDNWCQALVSVLRAGVASDVVRGLHCEPPMPPFVGHVHNDPGWPDHLDAALVEAEGRYEAAVVAYERALSNGGRRRWVPQAADVHQGLARCLLILGRTSEARAHAEQAVALLEDWSGWRRTEALALLRRLGGASVAAGPGSLTAREREVASLVAEGLSNSEIAAKLYISRRTAAVHVSHILTKLGMTTRAEVAAWAVRMALAQ